mmetsp:Transcript_13354/g.31300  ORF Transcript_13354/g.31300 Transcript_13354/m.31300 type:complete len:116 (-) Transcript_13354:260-607(-)
MGKRKRGGAEEGGGDAEAADGGQPRNKESKMRASEMRISLTKLSNDALDERLRVLSAELDTAKQWRDDIRIKGPPPGMNRVRASTHAVNAVYKASGAYEEVVREMERRGLRARSA